MRPASLYQLGASSARVRQPTIAEEVGSVGDLIMTPSMLREELDIANLSIETLGKEIFAYWPKPATEEAVAKWRVFKGSWISFQQEWRRFYKSYDSWMSRVTATGGTLDRIARYKEAAKEWRARFVAVGGTSYGGDVSDLTPEEKAEREKAAAEEAEEKQKDKEEADKPKEWLQYAKTLGYIAGAGVILFGLSRLLSSTAELKREWAPTKGPAHMSNELSEAQNP